MDLKHGFIKGQHCMILYYSPWIQTNNFELEAHTEIIQHTGYGYFLQHFRGPAQNLDAVDY